MAIKFLCPNKACRTELTVGDELAGQKVKCPKCKTVMVVPRPDSGTNADDSTGYEATMALEENLVEEEQPEEDGVESLERVLDETSPAARRYVMGKELAHGGMGAVLLAKDKAIQRELAVKVMRPQIADSEEHRLRFLEEAQVTGQLEHPNIVPIHELGKDAEGNLYFTMKLVKGRSLGEILTELKDEEAPRKDAKTQGEGRREKGKESSAERRPHRSLALQSRESPEGAEKNSALESQATMSLTELLNVFIKVCDGIAFAHSKGVIHRDLKPDNIMVGEFGEVQIMDWGLAKVVGDKGQGTRDEGQGEEGISDQSSVTSEEAPDSSSLKPETRNLKTDSAIRKADTVRSVRSDSDVALTVDGQITGTPAYMPPEQAEGKLELIDHRSDVYSLGAILYEILTLKRPIEGDTVHKVLLNVSEGKVTPPEKRAPRRNVPKELSAITLKAMEKNRRKRYQSVLDLGQDIKWFLEGRSVSAKEDTFVESVAKLVKRNKAVSAAVAAAVLILLLVSAVFMVNLRKERDTAFSAQAKAEKAFRQMTENALKASKQMARQTERALLEGRVEEGQVRAEAAASSGIGPWGLYALGKVALAKGDFENAVRQFEEALRREPNHSGAKLGLSEALARSGRMKQALSLVGDHAGKTWVELKEAGDVLFAERRHREAESAYRQALEVLTANEALVPETADWQAVVAKADAAAGSRLFGLAVSSYRKALELFKTQQVSPSIVSSTKGKLGQMQKSFDDEKHVLEIARANTQAWTQCEGFYESIRGLPAEEQWARVCKKMDEVHEKEAQDRPFGVDPFARPHFENGVLCGINTNSERTKYLQPLYRLPLVSLTIVNNLGTVTDLTPLEGMPLEALQLGGTGDPVPLDCNPLRGLPLRSLALESYRLRNLEALAGLPLEDLTLNQTSVSNLSPLRRLKLKSFCFGSDLTQSVNLSPIADMPIERLVLGSGALTKSLEFLERMPLTELTVHGGGFRDLSSLKGKPLRFLRLSQCFGITKDLGGLKAAPLKTFISFQCNLQDLSDLAGLPIEVLQITYASSLTDISVLRQLPLKRLCLTFTGVEDFSPIAGKDLEYFDFVPSRMRDPSILATLKSINPKICPWVPYLMGRLSRAEEEEFASMRKAGSSSREWDFPSPWGGWIRQYARWYLGYKKELEGNVPEAIKEYEAAIKKRPDLRSYIDLDALKKRAEQK